MPFMHSKRNNTKINDTKNFGEFFLLHEIYLWFAATLRKTNYFKNTFTY